MENENGTSPFSSNILHNVEISQRLAGNEDKGSSCDNAVEAVKNTAVAGEEDTVILDAVATLDKGEDKVAYLGNNGNEKAENCKYPNSGETLHVHLTKHQSVDHATDDTEDDAADAALDSLLRADGGDKLVASEESAAEICEGICHPGRNEHEEVYLVTYEVSVAGEVTKLDDGDEAGDDVCTGGKCDADLINRHLTL